MAVQPKIALVIDWLTTMGGAEQVLLELHRMYPEAPIYTSVYDKEKMKSFNGCDVHTSYLQRILPRFIRYKHVLQPVLRAHAFRTLNLKDFDLIISVSGAEAKAVKKRSDATHICYCNTPTRYYWSHYEEFKNEFNFGVLNFIIRPLIPLFVKWMRKLDLEAAARVDHYIANSEEVKKRIKKYYKRDSVVIFPPIDVMRFAKITQASNQKKVGFVIWGRHVPYKRLDLAIQASNKLRKKLTVIGTGPDTKRLKNLAGPTIYFPGRISDEELNKTAAKAEAFLFPGDEDFGIAPVEALAAGLPVIAYQSGGALDYIQAGKNGLFFKDQSVEALTNAINSFHPASFKTAEVKKTADKFKPQVFHQQMNNFVKKHTRKG